MAKCYKDFIKVCLGETVMCSSCKSIAILKTKMEYDWQDFKTKMETLSAVFVV